MLAAVRAWCRAASVIRLFSAPYLWPCTSRVKHGTYFPRQHLPIPTLSQALEAHVLDVKWRGIRGRSHGSVFYGKGSSVTTRFGVKFSIVFRLSPCTRLGRNHLAFGAYSAAGCRNRIV